MIDEPMPLSENSLEVLPEDSPEPSMDDSILKLETELQKIREDLLRAMAEIDNSRKRALKEQDEVRKYATTTFARDILTVLDNLNRALSSIPPTLDTPVLQTIVSGVDLVTQEFVKVLERHGIRSIDALNHPFDPNWHQAISQIPSDTTPPGTVVQVHQEGYTLHDRLLRPSLVAVSKSAHDA